ncbi:MAG TPA: SMI1/KNR4 family protein, partial [Pyrinomonadaceae bacterium]
HWLSHNVKFNAGVSEAALAAFEHQFGVSLPSDLRNYFLTINGMPEEETDNEMIRFWMLDEVKDLPAGAPTYASADYVDDPESLFLFADYSLWAHAYAIRLLATPSPRNEIFIIGGDYPILLFQSFSELVDSYLTDRVLMFPQSSIR